MNFSSNPTVKTSSGFPVATLNIDKTHNIYSDVYIYGSTLNPNVHTAYKGKIATCGDASRFSYAASDPTNSLRTTLGSPNLTSNKVINLLDLFSFAQPDALYPTTACLEKVFVCDIVDCDVGNLYTQQVIIDGFTLIIRQDIPQYPIEISVAVLQPNFSWLKLPLFLEICGYETISTVLPGTLILNQELLGNAR